MEKYIPVVVIKELNETDKILTALKHNGINCAEITFRTACAKGAIEHGVKKYPDMSIVSVSPCLYSISKRTKSNISCRITIPIKIFYICI